MVRPLTHDDIPAAYELSSLAGWNQTQDDWRFLLEAGDDCFAIELERRLAATATLICYGHKLGWVGMVLTHPDFRRRGFARLLMGQIIDRAIEREMTTIKLDATDLGRSLYESLGFRAEQPIERWERKGATESDGVPRGRIERDDGYILDRPGRLNRYLGPCVARSAGTARELIGEMVSRSPDVGWFWDLLPANRAAVEIAGELGFERVRTLTRMYWGGSLRENEEQVFAISGFELG